MVNTRALIETATGAIVNIIEIEADVVWACPVGFELRDTGDNDEARIGGRWDGDRYIDPVVTIPRFVELMNSLPVIINADDTETPKTELELKAESDELLTLLQAKLADTGDLTWEEMNKMLALERES